MYQVTVEDRAGADMVLRQPKVDNVIRCDGTQQPSSWEPWQIDSDATLTGAQVYMVQTTGGGPGTLRLRADWACIYVFDEVPDWWHPVWARCGADVATNGNITLSRDVKKGQWIAGHATDKCLPGQVWDFAISISLKRK
jgi:hypothetical protein